MKNMIDSGSFVDGKKSEVEGNNNCLCKTADSFFLEKENCR